MKTAKEILEEVKVEEELRNRGWTREKCRSCLGVGHSPQGMKCMVCDGTGYRGWMGPIER